MNMTQPRRTTGRTQQAKQPAKQENPRVTTTPLEKNKMAWKIELELPAGGTISVNAANNIDLLAAYNGLMTVQEALKCEKCQGTNVRLTHKTMSGSDGDYEQYVMCCQNPDCRAMYSFSALRDAPEMLVESHKEEYRGWTLPNSQSNGNGGSKQTSTRGGQSQSRSTRQSRQQEEEYEEEEGEETDQGVPF
jgi:hypothetical protein